MMNRNVKKLLEAARNSNGGGVWSDDFVPSAVRIAIEHNWIKQKPGSQTLTRKGMLLILTKPGRAALVPDVRETTLGEAVARESRKTGEPPWQI